MVVTSGMLLLPVDSWDVSITRSPKNIEKKLTCFFSPTYKTSPGGSRSCLDLESVEKCLKTSWPFLVFPMFFLRVDHQCQVFIRRCYHLFPFYQTVTSPTTRSQARHNDISDNCDRNSFSRSRNFRDLENATISIQIVGNVDTRTSIERTGLIQKGCTMRTRHSSRTTTTKNSCGEQLTFPIHQALCTSAYVPLHTQPPRLRL
jgi:G:T-mismatch repair DNA endonuclease (very short patch repair protein)